LAPTVFPGAFTPPIFFREKEANERDEHGAAQKDLPGAGEIAEPS